LSDYQSISILLVNIIQNQQINQMNKLTLALGIVLLGTIVSSPKAFALNQHKSEPLLVAQAKPQQPQLEAPRTKPLSTPSSNSESSDSSNVEKLLKTASESLESGDYNKAIENCNTVLKIEPNNLSAYLVRGFAYVASKKYQPAISDFSKAIEIDPKLHYAYFGRGLALVRLKQYKQSLADLNQTIKLEPEYAHAYYWRGISQSYLGNKKAAISDLRTAANLYKKEGKADDAKDALDLIKELS
jgi:tetratricopeptide (TPR) repeat protein